MHLDNGEEEVEKVKVVFDRALWIGFYQQCQTLSTSDCSKSRSFRM